MLWSSFPRSIIQKTWIFRKKFCFQVFISSFNALFVKFWNSAALKGHLPNGAWLSWTFEMTKLSFPVNFCLKLRQLLWVSTVISFALSQPNLSEFYHVLSGIAYTFVERCNQEVEYFGELCAKNLRAYVFKFLKLVASPLIANQFMTTVKVFTPTLLFTKKKDQKNYLCWRLTEDAVF